MYYRNLQSKRKKMVKKIVSLMFLKKVNNELSVLVCTKPHSDEYILPHSTITGPLTISELHNIAKKVGVDSRGILYRSIYESYSSQPGKEDKQLSTYMVVECSGIPDDFGNWYENVMWMDFERFLASKDEMSEEVRSLISYIQTNREAYRRLLVETKIP